MKYTGTRVYCDYSSANKTLKQVYFLVFATLLIVINEWISAHAEKPRKIHTRKEEFITIGGANIRCKH